MVTASHNPLDSNGFKFLTGCTRGQVTPVAPGALISTQQMAGIISAVSAYAGREGIAAITAALDAATPAAVQRALEAPGHDHQRMIAERAYLDSIGDDWGLTPHCLAPYTLGPVLLDPNGGAGCGIGARVLEHFGVRVIEVNAEPGQPEHGIDTDGLDPVNGRQMLLRVARAAARERTHFGVAFDYDADRGNLVLPGCDEQAIVPPQCVATFNIALLLAHRQRQGAATRPLAVVLSDATSLASHRVALAFGAEIAQVETGEINVVTRMAELRVAGYDVPIGVEGANGGTIFASATCRDGLQVALAAARAEASPTLSRAMQTVLRGGDTPPDAQEQSMTLVQLLAVIPRNPNIMRKLQAPPQPPAEVKQRLEAGFMARYWPAFSSRFASYAFENFEGTRMGHTRSGDESGAWRLHLTAPDRSAFLFLRGSRTEPGVWRMIVDAEHVEDFHLVQAMADALFKEATGTEDDTIHLPV